MIRCIIIDDEIAGIEVLSIHTSRLSNIELVGTDTDPIRGIELIKEKAPDLVLSDFDMNDVNGLDLAKQIDKSIAVIICTGDPKIVKENLGENVVGYLQKPIVFREFEKAILQLISKRSSQPPIED